MPVSRIGETSDIALTRAVRGAIGATPPLRLDVNGAWTPGTARRQLRKLPEFDPFYVEQPLELDDLDGHALLRKVQSVPIALDESAYTLNDVGNIVRADAADVILLDPHEAGGLWQTVAVVLILTIAGGTGYYMRQLSLQSSDVSTQPMTGSTSPLGDLSPFRTITQDTLDKLNAGDQPGATTRIRDLETEWDNAEARLKPKSPAEWTQIDDKIDAALRQLRAVNPNPATEKTALQDLLAVLK